MKLTNKEQKTAAKAFAEEWLKRGDEKGETAQFWRDLLENVYGVKNPSNIIQFEKRVQLENVSFIDAYLPETKVLIEQKSADIDLNAKAKQSDGSMLTPYEQARRYGEKLNYSEHPRYIVVCNFKEFHIHDMEKPNDAPAVIELKNLHREFHRLEFIVRNEKANLVRELELSIKAGEIVGKLYDAILKRYNDPSNPETLKSLNMLCVRLVFCLYAEDAGIFPLKNQFHDYLAGVPAEDIREALINLFKVLDTKIEDRDPYLKPDLNAFPYVNGGLFADAASGLLRHCVPRNDEQPFSVIAVSPERSEPRSGLNAGCEAKQSTIHIQIPQFTQEIVDILLTHASAEFDWSEISPTIFGAVFESTLNPDTRRKGGMHYTSIENIHKVIDPLFLDDLKAEFEKIRNIGAIKEKRRQLAAFQDKLASIKFLDPACGSGNFLTETYISLRTLENDCLRILYNNQTQLALDGIIKVSIEQFYGIEINDFAVTVARTALWIAESQMMNKTEDIVCHSLDFLPLKSYPNIVENNALKIDWKSILVKSGENYDYIMGNPPFVGYSLQSKEQKEDILSLYVDEKGKPYKTAGKIDYVAGWYWKAAELMQGTTTRAALVSTNSITQGEQVAAVWKPLMERFGLEIDFAHRTFRWDSEASIKAHVHCVIVGFSVSRRDAEEQRQETSLRGAKRRSNPDLTCEKNGDADSHKLNADCGRAGARIKKIFTDGVVQEAKNINAYLLDADNVFVGSRSKPLCDVPEMTTGNRPADGGHLIIEEEDYATFIKKEPDAFRYIKRLMGSAEFINKQERYCLWLVGASPADLRRMPLVMQRIEACKQDRLNSPDEGRRKLAITPTLFREQLNPKAFLIVPKVSSEKRMYVPIGFYDDNTIPTDLLFIIPNATLYHFGVLTSSIHMAWMRAVCGRLKSDYRYSKDIVYNNFPWPADAGLPRTASGARNDGVLHGTAGLLRHGVPRNDVSRTSPACDNTPQIPSIPKIPDNKKLCGDVVDAKIRVTNILCASASLREKITQTAQDILDTRARYPDASLADLYDELTMPPDLRKAHQANDRAVLEAYGFNPKLTEPEIVAELMKMYQVLVDSEEKGK